MYTSEDQQIKEWLYLEWCKYRKDNPEGTKQEFKQELRLKYEILKRLVEDEKI